MSARTNSSTSSGSRYMPNASAGVDSGCVETNDVTLIAATVGEISNITNDMLEQAIDQLICRDINLERMCILSEPGGSRSIRVDDRVVFRVTVEPERRDDEYLMVARGVWLP